MPAGRLAVLGLRRCVLMTPAEAKHSHTAGTTREGMQGDDRGEQNGEGTFAHGIKCIGTNEDQLDPDWTAHLAHL